jgi:predicted phosphohydrolase
MSKWLLLLSIVVCVFAQNPDNSTECVTCEATVSEFEYIFDNATDIAIILDELDAYCKSNYSREPEKLKICYGVMNILVQIPPALFDGMESLAWDIPLGFCATLLLCHVECCPTPYGPEQIHLALTGDLSEMAVSWTTLNATAANTVQYGTSSSSLSQSVEGFTTTYESTGWLGVIHHAEMTNLLASTTYYYRVGSAKENVWSDIYSFKTFSGKSDQTITYAVLGDMAYDENSDWTVANVQTLVEQGKVDIVLHVGDISYADGYDSHFDDFLNKVQPIATRVPYMVSPGNHEFWYDFSAYKHRFHMPGASISHGMNYSFTLGPIHFVSCNSETAVDTGRISPDQQAWIDQDMATVDRQVTPWLMVYFHRPMYCSNLDDDNCRNMAVWLRYDVEDLLNKYKTDLVITGHVHNYERTYSVYDNITTSTSYVNPPNPVYLVQGASGNREGNDGPPRNAPDWTAAVSGAIGFAIMQVTTSSVDWSFYAASSSGPSLVDHFVLSKN